MTDEKRTHCCQRRTSGTERSSHCHVPKRVHANEHRLHRSPMRCAQHRNASLVTPWSSFHSHSSSFPPIHSDLSFNHLPLPTFQSWGFLNSALIIPCARTRGASIDYSSARRADPPHFVFGLSSRLPGLQYRSFIDAHTRTRRDCLAHPGAAQTEAQVSACECAHT